MAKGQIRSNKEARKPKADKNKPKRPGAALEASKTAAAKPFGDKKKS